MKNLQHPSTVVCADVEASALENGFPIEIGLYRGDGEGLNVLVKPPQDWLSSRIWSTDAEKVHGITLGQLQTEGASPTDVVARVNQFIGDQKTLIVGHFKDREWFNSLYHAAEVGMSFSVVPINEMSVLGPETRDLNLRDAYDMAVRGASKTHIAYQDAELIHRVYTNYYTLQHNGTVPLVS